MWQVTLTQHQLLVNERLCKKTWHCGGNMIMDELKTWNGLKDAGNVTGTLSSLIFMYATA